MCVCVLCVQYCGREVVLREVEAVFPLSQCKPQPLSHDLNCGVVGQLQVVDTCHHRGEKAVWGLWRFDRLPNNG